MEKYDDENGVWRTIRGRRVFIRDGESLGSAMSRSGKFKREDIREGKHEARLDTALDKTKFASENKRKKIAEKYDKKQASKEEYSYRYKHNANNQAEKNRIHEDRDEYLPGKTRVERNYPKYSKTDRREVEREELQKKLAEYKAKKQSNNKSDLVGLKKEGNKYIPIRKDDEANKELKVSDLKNKSTKEIMNMKLPQTKEGKKAFNKFIAENRNDIAKELKNGDYKADSIGNYMKTISRKPKENDIILSGGKNGEDVRVGKNGKLEVLTNDDFDSNNVYVGKKQKIDDFKARKQSNNRLTDMLEKDKKALERYNKYKISGVSEEEAYKLKQEKEKQEYELYKRAKENPESIDPMTENSTDWEALEKKYGKQETIKNYVEKKKSNNAQTTNRILERSGKVNQKTLKSYADDGLATDITRYSEEDIKKLEKKHGRLTSIKTSMGTYGMNGMLLKSEKTGEYFVITARNTNIFRF